jgi:hypothetical protein
MRKSLDRSTANEDGMGQQLRELMRKKVAVSAIPTSALRRQGLAGLLAGIRSFCAALPLESLVTRSQPAFEEQLDKATADLQSRVAALGCKWGAARKSLNLFVRDAAYNHYLRSEYRLDDIEGWLEVPLDGQVAEGLAAEPGGDSLPAWPGVRDLSPKISREYQRFAEQVASRRGRARVHLDLEYWPAFSRAAF